MRMRLFCLISLALATSSGFAASYTISLPAGYSLIANQLDSTLPGGNTLDNVLPNMPDFTELFRWDCTAWSPNVSTYIPGFGWDSGGPLNPGEGAVINLPSAMTITFTGTPHVPVLPFLPCGCNAYNLLSRQTTNAPTTFQDLTGFAPTEGTSLYRYNPSAPAACSSGGLPPLTAPCWIVYTFSGGLWGPNPPTLNLGESAFIYVPCSNGCCPDTGGVKYLQNPDLTNGIDVNATFYPQDPRDILPWVLADDFPCTNSGPITDIHLWGSWLSDQVDYNAIYTLAIWSDVPTNGGAYSHPGDLLWSQTYSNGQYTLCPYTNQFEYFYDGDSALFGTPSFLGTSSNLFYLCFDANPTNVFYQTGTPAAPTNYWLSVAVQSFGGSNYFGWKSSATAYNDAAVAAYNFNGIFYPLPGDWNPMTDTNGAPLNLAFKIRTATNPCSVAITCPNNIVVTSCVPIQVTYPLPTTTDTCPGCNVTVVCTPQSGSTFSLGTTPVNCKATNCYGYTASCTFTVTVRSPCPAQPLALFNTGVDQSGNLLVGGSVDPYYTLTSNPDNYGTKTFVVSQTHPSWLANDTSSQWIGPVTNQYAIADVGDYTYQMPFYVPCSNGLVTITGQGASDEVGAMYIDSTAKNNLVSGDPNLANAPPGWGFTVWRPFTFNGVLAQGPHMLLFVVTNMGGPTGLRVEFTNCTVTCLTCCTNCCLPPPNGMSAWWPFDEPTGSVANDIAGRVNNIGYYQGSPTPTPGMVSDALCFNGTSDSVLVSNQDEVNFIGSCTDGTNTAESFTIDAWIRASTNGPDAQALLDKRVNVGSPQGYTLFLYHGDLGFQMGTGLQGGFHTYTSSGPDLRDGQWHFIALTVARCATTNGNVGTLYVDNNAVLAFADPQTGDLNNGADLEIGQPNPYYILNPNPYYGYTYYSGCLDELEIYKRALSALDLQGIFNAGSCGKCKTNCLSCLTTNAVILNTGFNHPAGTVYGAGAADAFWNVVADPTGGTVPRPAMVVLEALPGWGAAQPNSQWISDYATALNGVNTNYDFQTCFCLTNPFSNILLQFCLLADDWAHVFLNDTLILTAGSPTHSVFYSGDAICTNGDVTSLCQAGRNCLRVRVYNAHGVAMGLNLAGTVTGSGLLRDNCECCPFWASLSGAKFDDLDGNGVWDAGEPALPGWTINLLSGSGAAQSTLTDGNGYYYFMSLLPGIYTVTEAQQSGWVQTAPAGPSYTVRLACAQAVNNLDFGNRQIATNRTNITAVVVGVTTLQLTWPADHIGWELQTQTNAIGVGISTNWQVVPGCTTTNQMTLPIDPANGSVFYRLRYVP